MAQESLNLKEAAGLLKVSERELAKRAASGVVPGHKVGVHWQFARGDIERVMARSGVASELAKTQVMPAMPIVANFLTPGRVNLGLKSADRDGVLRELVALVIEPHEKRLADALFVALKMREEMCPTCINEGVAIPHARNAIVGLVDRSVIAYGRSRRGVDFGALDGKPVHQFFLLCAPNVREHLRTLAQLARLMQQKELRDNLMTARSAMTVITLIREAEHMFRH